MELPYPFEILTPQQALARRLENLARAEASREGKLWFLKRCQEDVVFYADNCVDTVVPRRREGMTEIRSKNRPWFTCLRQAEALWQIKEAKTMAYDMMWPKSRNVGQSWIHMIDESHDWYFTEGYSSIIGSRNINLVENAGNMNALFPKMDFIYRHYPQWMHIPAYSGDPTKAGYKGEGKSPYKVQGLRINPINGAQVNGEAVTEDFGAGGRGGKVTIDEIAKCQNGEQGWKTAGETADSRHGIFTPEGKNFAYGLCFPEDWKQITGLRDVESPAVFRLHWKDIPWQNKFYLLTIGFDLEDPPWQVDGTATPLRRRLAFTNWLEDAIKDHYAGEGNGYSPFDPIGCRLDEAGIPYDAGYDDGRGNIHYLNERRPIERPPANAISCIHPWRILAGFRYDEEEAAKQLDISFGGRSGRSVYSVQLRNTKRDTALVRDRTKLLYAFCDPGRGDGNAFYLGWAQWDAEKGKYECLKEISYEGKSAYFYRAFLTGNEKHWEEAVAEGATTGDRMLFEEMQHPMWRVNMLYGDPAAMAAKTANSKDSVKGIFEDSTMGPGVPVIIDHNHRDFDTRILNARRVLQYTEIDPYGCPKLKAGLEGIRFPDANLQNKSTSPTRGYIHHPLYSHPCAAFEYFACMDPHQYDREEFEEDDPDVRAQNYWDGRRKPHNRGKEQDDFDMYTDRGGY